MSTITRSDITIEQFNQTVADLQAMVPGLRENAGVGAFASPQEIAGMVAEEAQVLTAATKLSQRTGDEKPTRERCLKFAYALLFAAASID